MTSVAVIAHRKKSLGGGLVELRQRLADEGVTDPAWTEVARSKKAPKAARRARDAGADLVIVWGGDGMVQRCVDALAGSGVAIAIIPAGTANLLATNLGIPRDLEQAVCIALHGERKPIDLGVCNGEHFAVMAGAGLDALMIRDADRGLKDRIGRLAYVVTGVRHVRRDAVGVRIDIDGNRWFKGDATCVLLGNVGTISGGLRAFAAARPDDGVLEIGVVTAEGAMQWARVMARLATNRAHRSPFVEFVHGHEFRIAFDRPVPYELDGGDRDLSDLLEVRVEPAAITICVSEEQP
jgi:YegS/Rv2252/BmrU family lipid kinase